MIAQKMGHLQFEFSVIPVVKYEDGTELPKDVDYMNMTLTDKPMWYEKDEIKLREKWFYQ